MLVCKFIYELEQKIVELNLFGNVNLLQLQALIYYEIYRYRSIIMLKVLKIHTGKKTFLGNMHFNLLCIYKLYYTYCYLTFRNRASFI
jgi:hypothetical protein